MISKLLLLAHSHAGRQAGRRAGTLLTTRGSFDLYSWAAVAAGAAEEDFHTLQKIITNFVVVVSTAVVAFVAAVVVYTASAAGSVFVAAVVVSTAPATAS